MHLRRHREAAGLTRAQLAAAAEVSRKTVDTLENGMFVPSTELALRLARVLGAPVEALVCLPPDGTPEGPRGA